MLVLFMVRILLLFVSFCAFWWLIYFLFHFTALEHHRAEVGVLQRLAGLQPVGTAISVNHRAMHYD